MIRRKKLSGSTFIAAVAIVFAALGLVFAQDQPWNPNVSPLPTPTGFVNDYAGVIDTATKQQLEDKLKAFKEKTTVEIAVAVVRTTGDRDIFDYSLAVARGWKIGSKDSDNPGALLFIAVDDRKYFTQVSRDLEDELPDGLAGSLQRQYLVPEFKKGNYAKGISDTIDAYIQTIRDKGNGVVSSTPEQRQTRPGTSRSGGGSSGGSDWGGGGGGGFGGGGDFGGGGAGGSW